MAVIFCILTGCATLPAAPSLSAVRVIRTQEALDSIARAYEQKDITRLESYFHSLASLFRGSIEQDFKTFDTTLHMQIKRVDLREDVIHTEVFWEGRWSPLSSASPPLSQTGYALMAWSLDESPILLEMRGDLPWGIQPMDPADHE